MRLTKTVFFDRCFDKRRFQSFLHWFFKTSPRGHERLLTFLEKLKFVGFHSATEAGFSISIEDLKIPPSKSSILQSAEKSVFEADFQWMTGSLTTIEHYQRILEIWHRTSEKLKYQVLQSFQSSDLLNPIYLMAFSGARGNISQIRQLVGMRGLMADPQGQIIDFPIRSNFREGLTLTEYLISCSGARKGIVDTALRTAASGYLTRRLVDVAHHVVISQMDCQFSRGAALFTSSNQPMGILIESLYDQHKKILPLKQRLIGRVLAENIRVAQSDRLLASKNQEISPTLSHQISAFREKVCVRSPLTCRSSKFICQLCYGWNLAEGQLVSVGEAVGVLAAQSIGEPGTQLTMRTFHTGGVFTGRLLDQTYAPFSGQIYYPSFCYGFLIRTFQGHIAYLSKNSGIFHLKVASSNRQQHLEKMYWQCQKIVSSHFSAMSDPSFSRKHKFERQFGFQKTTLLYARQGEWVKKTQLLAEIPFLETDDSAENEQEILASLSGEMHFENLIFLEKTMNEQMVKNVVQVLGELWILSGQPFQFLNYLGPLRGLRRTDRPSFFQQNAFFKKLDLVNHQVAFFQVHLNPSSTKLRPFLDSSSVFPTPSSLHFEYSKNKDFVLCFLFFKNIGYLQIAYRSLSPCLPKKCLQILNGYASSTRWKNWTKRTSFRYPNYLSDTHFQTWKMGFQRKYSSFRFQLFQICLKSTSFSRRHSLPFFPPHFQTTLGEFPKCLFLQNFYWQKNSCIVDLTRQGHRKLCILYQDRKTPFCFDPPERRVGRGRFASLLSSKTYLSDTNTFFDRLRPLAAFRPTVPFVITLGKPRPYKAKHVFFSMPKNKSRSYLSLLFLNQLKLTHHQPHHWHRQNLQRQPRIVHWKNLSPHKYLFFINYFQPLWTKALVSERNNALSSMERPESGLPSSVFQQKQLIKMGFFSWIRVFFCQPKSRTHQGCKIFVRSAALGPRTNCGQSLALSQQRAGPNRSFFQFLLSLQILFYTNLLKKYQQNSFFTHEAKKAHLSDVLQIPILFCPSPETFYSVFFLQGFFQKKLDKREGRSLGGPAFTLPRDSFYHHAFHFPEQFFRKQLNVFQFANFSHAFTNNFWEFFGDRENVFTTMAVSRPTIPSSYFKTFVEKKSRSYQCTLSTLGSERSLWPPLQRLSRKKKKGKRPSQSIFFLEKILPSSLTEGSRLLENAFVQNPNWPFGSAKLPKWRLENCFQLYAGIVHHCGLITNFARRFSHKSPKKPLYNRLFLTKQTQLSTKLKPTHSRDFQNFSIEYMAKKSSPVNGHFPSRSATYRFPKFEKGSIQNRHTYTLRSCPSLFLSRRFQEACIVGRKYVLKKMYLNLPSFSYVCTCRKDNFSISKIKFLEKLTKKPLQPNFQIFTHLKTCFQKGRSPGLPPISFRNQHLSIQNLETQFHYSYGFYTLSFSKKHVQLCLPHLSAFHKGRASFRNLQYVSNAVRGPFSPFDSILEKTPSLTLHFFQIHALGPPSGLPSVNRGPQSSPLHIFQKEWHPRCLERPVVLRFYLPFPDGEMVHDHPLFIQIGDLFSNPCPTTAWRPTKNVHFPPKIRSLRPMVLPKCLNNLNNWQFLSLKFRFYQDRTRFVFLEGRGTAASRLNKFQNRNMTVFSLGALIKAGYHVEPRRGPLSMVNSGQFLAQTRQNLLFRKATLHLLNDQSILHAQHGEILSKHQRICSVFYHQSKTGDIVQGIPKIEEIFEARKKSKYSLHQFLSKERLGHLSDTPTIFQISTRPILYYLQNLQKSVINNIQRIYCGQGVHIADKHIEIIIRQMTANVLILEPGQTGLLYGEIVAFQWILKMHSTVLFHQVVYEPLFLGITKTCLETSSFLSAASFQETTRILSRAALQNQIDFLRGLKQNVLLGNLVPLGTGCFRPLCT
uniref:DNA-directed RNA polymerase n=1 Tax=Rhipilia penicilloides TaxID=1979422 RepID=A0A2P0QHJ6_9CHLO|nr:RNA polymerase b-subunit [Rhipilia penicilloides]ARO74241.1 RNA polymerase b-subunit [Rhipilia penicilloides]